MCVVCLNLTLFFLKFEAGFGPISPKYTPTLQCQKISFPKNPPVNQRLCLVELEMAQIMHYPDQRTELWRPRKLTFSVGCTFPRSLTSSDVFFIFPIFDVFFYFPHISHHITFHPILYVRSPSSGSSDIESSTLINETDLFAWNSIILSGKTQFDADHLSNRLLSFSAEV